MDGRETEVERVIQEKKNTKGRMDERAETDRVIKQEQE